MEEQNGTLTELLTMVPQHPDTLQVVLSLAAALGLALVMWFAYRKANSDDTYRPNFAVTLISLALLSAILMDLVKSNLALSLGMLGSLSIIRFRTTIKDPRDIGFIFWAMVIGLAAATGSYATGLIGSVVVAACILLTARHGTPDRKMLLVIRGSETNLERIGNLVGSHCTRSQVQAKNVMADSFELVYDVQIPMPNSNELIQDLFALEGIDAVNLLSEAKHA